MPETHGSPEVESDIHRPGSWLALSVGACFLVAGVIGFLTIAPAVPPGFPFWFARFFTAIFALLGGVVTIWAIRASFVPIHIRHAGPDVLPNVSREPVICEGSVVHGRLSHELVEDAKRWHFRPVRHLWRDDKVFFLGVGIPMMVLFSGLLSWALHNQLHIAGWPLSILCGTLATFVCGVSVFFLMGLMQRAGYRRLCQLYYSTKWGRPRTGFAGGTRPRENGSHDRIEMGYFLERPSGSGLRSHASSS